MALLSALHKARGRVKAALTRYERKFSEEVLAYADTKAILSEIDSQADDLKKIVIQIEAQVSDEPIEVQEVEDKEADDLWVRISDLRCKARVKMEEARPSESGLPSNPPANATSSLENAMSKMFEKQEKMMEQLTETTKLSSQSMQSNIPRIRLPQLQQPTFTGKYTEWQGFKDLFEATVHNSDTLSKVEKLQYLKLSLKGDAEAVVKNLPITGDNYDNAWTKLKERFDKKPQIATAHIERFLNNKPVREAKVSLLKQAYDTHKEAIEALEQMGPEFSSKDVWLVHLMQSSMDHETRRLWSQELKAHEVPSINQWFDFMRWRMDSLEVYGETQEASNIKDQNSSKKGKSDGVIKAHHTDAVKCSHCNQGSHPLFQCETFKKLAVKEKRNYVAGKNLCFNCLKEGHRAQVCRSNGKCQKCQKRHHTLLHEESRSTNNVTTDSQGESTKKDTSSEGEQNKKPPAKETELPVHHMVSTKKILLPTAVVKVNDVYGNQQFCRILIDPGATCTLITEACAQRLKLPRQQARLAIKGTGETHAGYTRGAINMKMMSQYNEENAISVVAYAMEKLTSYLPAESFSTNAMKHIEGLQLADPEFNHPAKIDIILGMEYAWEINLPEMRKESGCPTAQLTIFGWVLGGGISEDYAMPDCMEVHHTHCDCDVDKVLVRFWESETLPEKKIITKEEQRCEDEFSATYKRDETGRFTVKLNFKEDREKLGNSYYAAQARLMMMERKFKDNPDFHKQYVDFMEEYLALGHMEEVPKDEINKEETYVIPHQAVVRPSSTTTKLRVVFDASCKSRNGNSLNDVLAIGPQMQDDLLAIMLRFRTFKVAFQADVEKMYRQVLIAEEDRDFQRILWRSNPLDPMKLYRLKTITYGMSDAPFLATRCLHQMGTDSKEKYPDACNGIQQGFYMDDLLYGAETVEEAVRVSEEIKTVLKGGGFNLRKWASSSQEVLKTKEPQELATFSQEGDAVSTLGMKWYPERDVMKLQIHIPQEVKTKREYLSEAAKVYDPMGIIGPVTIRFKMLFQKIWLTTKDWNDDLSEEDLKEYNSIRKDFELLQSIEIERCLPHDGHHMEIHAFADASDRAVAAVVYARMYVDGAYRVQLFMSKARVAPLTPASTPRLELKAAVLLSQIVKKIKESYSHLEVSVTAWSDSTTVLQWLQSHPRRWKQYVAGRTAEILEVLTPQAWRYVPSKMNPADCLSRGLKPSELVNHPIWWKGPKWLSQDEKMWPENKVIIPVKTGEERNSKCTDDETARKMLMHTTNAQEVDKQAIKRAKKQAMKEEKEKKKKESGRFSLYDFLKDKSCYGEMVYAAACLIRIGQPKEKRNVGPITVTERRNAIIRLIQDVQHDEFEEEIKRCRRGEQVSNSSKILRLAPFLDDEQILRARGRIRHSSLKYKARHPILLPKEHRFVEMLIAYYHKIHLHAGFNQLTCLLRSEFWIVGGRDMVRRVINRCITCFKYRPTLQAPIMGDLPAVRVKEDEEYEAAFVDTGCDYAGPFEIKTSTLRNARIVKGYVCLFVCMKTTAVHLEAVGDQSSEGFINALTRFTCRRGNCKNIHCDNGRCFVGAAATSEDVNKLRGKVCRIMAEANIQFHFTPPYAPNFGGLWERAVGSTKYHLRRVMGEMKPTFETFSTILCQVEACLNSRPLCAMSVEPENDEILTPGHFLGLRSLKLLPSEDKTNIPINRLRNYELIQRAVQSHWKRWKNDFITGLQQRPKWMKERSSLEPGDLVLIKENNTKPGHWPRGRVVECYPGADNVTRVVKLKTAGGIIKRSVRDLAKLPNQ